MPTKQEPSFTRDQIVTITDVQRKWRSTVEPKLDKMPYLVMFSGSEPRTAVLSYEKFEELWQQAQEASELALQLEVLARATSASHPLSLDEVVRGEGITKEDIKRAPDVDLESE